MLIDNIKAPTSEQIATNAKVAEDEHEIAFACWYPQMGTYVGKCVVIFSKKSDDDRPPCFTALVWHDGEFPFKPGDDLHGGRPPARIHHCAASQFIRFGELVNKLQHDNCELKPPKAKPNP